MWPGNDQGMSSGDAVAIKGGQMGALGEANRWPIVNQNVSQKARTWPGGGKGFARRCQGSDVAKRRQRIGQKVSGDTKEVAKMW
jgi:hypothetical protein